jgi:subtilisin family serine protease
VTLDGVSKPDLVAPGRNIVSTLAPWSTLARQFPSRVIDDTYIRLSGTSAAAPVVSGVVAQLLQAHPSLSPGQVKWLLARTALPVNGPGTGAGYPRVGAAIESRAIGDATSGLVPNNYIAAAYTAKMGLTVSWNAVAWNTVAWNTVSWNSISWDSVSWNSVSWNNVASSTAGLGAAD